VGRLRGEPWGFFVKKKGRDPIQGLRNNGKAAIPADSRAADRPHDGGMWRVTRKNAKVVGCTLVV
jgi:hypothetical protein